MQESIRVGQGLIYWFRDSTLTSWTPWAPDGLFLLSRQCCMVSNSTKSHSDPQCTSIFNTLMHLGHFTHDIRHGITSHVTAGTTTTNEGQSPASHHTPLGLGTVLITLSLSLEDEAQQLLSP